MKKIISTLFLFIALFYQVAGQQKYSIDSTIVIKHDSLQIGATLRMPIGVKKMTAVVILSGTGKQDRNGTMAGHEMFAQLADFLAKNGVAVLTMDDRGVGKSTGTYEVATTKDFANDALVAIQFLHSYPQIDPQKIGLIGHSEGGAAMSIAAASDKDVHFLISLAGLAMNGFDSLIQQNEDLVNKSALSDFDKKRSNTINRLMFETALKYADSASMESRLNETYQTWKKKDDIDFVASGVKFDHFRFPIYSYVRTAIGPWYRNFVKYNAQETMKHIQVPVLALNGDQDVLVAGKQNLANWKTYIAAGGNKNVTTHLLTNINHLFLACKTCDLKEYRELNTSFSPEALNIIKDWITTVVK